MNQQKNKNRNYILYKIYICKNSDGETESTGTAAAHAEGASSPKDGSDFDDSFVEEFQENLCYDADSDSD